MRLEKAAQPVSIYNEINRLKEMLVWGEPGCEALLGQLLAKSKSLFLSFYQVTEARSEFRHMQSLIEKAGVNVIRVKDAYAALLKNKNIPDLPASLQELQGKLLAKADAFYETYREEKRAELAREGLKISPEEIFLEVKHDIQEVLAEDLQTYGEEIAIKLNYVLCLAQELPISNIVYGRDQSNALGDHIVLSVMRWDIRKPEVEIYKEALEYLGYQDTLVDVHAGMIEGGDSIIFGDACYIGVGARTSLEAVMDVYKSIGARLESKGIRLLAIVNQKHADESPTTLNPAYEHMQVMHLDMFWNPLDEKTVLAFGEEIDRRRVLEFSQPNGRVTARDIGSFREYLTEKQIEVVEITAQEQHDYAANIVNFGDKRILVPLSRNQRVIAELEKRGFLVIKAEILRLVGGYGAAHCLTAPIVRE